MTEYSDHRPRQLNVLAVKDEDDAQDSQSGAKIYLRPMMQDRDAKYQELKPQLCIFETQLIDYLERVRSACREERNKEEIDFEVHFDREVRKACNRVRLTFDDGKVSWTDNDGYAQLGISMGWTLQAVKTMRAWLYAELFEKHEKTYLPRAEGEKPENEEIEKISDAIVTHILRRGRYREAGMRLCNQIPQHGTGILRYELLRPVKFERDENGVYAEIISNDFEPRFTVWPIEDVFVTDIKIPNPREQELVFFLTPVTNLAVLEAHEAVFDIQVDQSDPMNPNPAVHIRRTGKFTNLNPIREAEKIWNRVSRSTDLTTGQDFNSSEKDLDSISTFPQFALVECEGRLNLAPWVESGHLTPEMVEYFGINLGTTYDMEDEEQKEEFMFRVSKLFLYIAYALDVSTSSTSKGRILVRLDDGLIPNYRNSMNRFICHNMSDFFYGASIDRVGHPMEAASDLIMNGQVWNFVQNSNQNGIINDAGLDNKDKNKIFDLLWGLNKWLKSSNPNVKPDDVAKFIKREFDHQLADAKIAQIKLEFEAATGVTSNAKYGTDTSGTNTARGMEMSASRINTELGFILYGFLNVQNNDLIPAILEDVYLMLGPEAFVEFAMEVAGLDATQELRVKLLDLGKWWERLDWGHPVSMGMDRAVMASGIVNAMTAVPGMFDRQKAGKAIAEAYVPRASDLMPDGVKTYEPDYEDDQIASGTWMKVNQGDDDQQHILAHSMKLQEVQGGQIPPSWGGDPNKVAVFMQSIPNHIQRHQQQLMLKLQIQQQQMMMSQGQNGGGHMGQGVGEQFGQANETEMMTQMQNQANMQGASGPMQGQAAAYV